MTTKVGLGSHFAARLLGEDGIVGVGTTVGRREGPAVSDGVAVGNVVIGTDRLSSSNTWA
jgi:hypothetical protein